MNTINKILILAIFIFILNHLTDGKLLDTVLSLFDTYKDKFENFIDNTVKINHNNSNDLYDFINDLINSDYNIKNIHKENVINITPTFNIFIIEQLNKILNFHGYKFTDIHLTNKPSYSNTKLGTLVESFNINSNAFFRGTFIGSVDIEFDLIVKNKYEIIITNANILNIKNIPDKNIHDKIINKPFKNSKSQKKAIKKNNELTSKMNDSFNNYFVDRENYDELFIKPSSTTKQQQQQHVEFNDTDNSLIPSAVEFSSYEQTSETESSN